MLFLIGSVLREKTMTDEQFMALALDEARLAAAEGEVPVGAVIVHRGEVIARAHNRREQDKNALAHAELSAIDSACRRLGGWRLIDCTLYVTLEPCPMCAGAIVNAQLPRVVVGATDEKMGALGGLFDLRAQKGLFTPQVESGLLGEESKALLQDFFRRLRREKNTSGKKA